MDLYLYNTLTRKKEKFSPHNKNEVKLYSCGPTVYWFQHVGNLSAYVRADVLKRTLKLAGYNVKHVMGITDVGHLVSDDDAGDDKMEKGAKRENISVWDIAEKYTKQFFQDYDSLNIIRADVICKATDYIKEQIQAVETLEKKGFTYTIKDGVYFDSSKDNDYGKLARLDIEGLCAGERVEMADKKCKTDFALWKLSKPEDQRQMEWNSPWGKGFPGWHIECSVFCLENLGDYIDIHTGGPEHIPVHHPNEMAQNKALIGHQVVKYWMHFAWVVLAEGGKMSKSSGHQYLIGDLNDKGSSPLAFRYLMLMSHYSSQVKYSDDIARSAYHSLCRLNNKIVGFKTEDPIETEKTKIWTDRIQKTLFDDLNTAVAITTLREALDDNNLRNGEKLFITGFIDQVLGLDLGTEKIVDIPENVTKMAEQRLIARQQKNWALSDILRDEIANAGFEVKDTADGYELKEKK